MHGFDDYYQCTLEQYFSKLPNQLNELLSYACFPAGKKFRANLLLHLCSDLQKELQDFYPLALSLEMHHLYTLIHDDLPSMDDDDYRRGRPSLHKKFDEASAILAGDGLLNYSYQLLAEMPHAGQLLKLYSRLLGLNGLIAGQFYDLKPAGQREISLQQIHDLKTARLIQVACLAAIYPNLSLSHFKDLYSLGLSLGRCFQLNDDWQDRQQVTEGLNMIREFSEEQVQANYQHERQKALRILANHQYQQSYKFLSQYFPASLG